MPILPTPTKTEEVADSYSIAKVEIYRSPDGFIDSSVTINAHIGQQKEEIDPVTTYNLFDAFETRTLVSLRLPELKAKLEAAEAAGLISPGATLAHWTALLQMDAALVALAEQSIELYRAAGIVTFPDKTSRFV